MATAHLIPEEDLSIYINVLERELNGQFLKVLVFKIAKGNPRIASLLRRKYNTVVQRQRARVVNFDHYSKSV